MIDFKIDKLLKYVHMDLDDECILSINKICLHIILLIPTKLKELKKFIDEWFLLIHKVKTKPKISPLSIRNVLKIYFPRLKKFSRISICLSYIIEHVVLDILNQCGKMAKMENKKCISNDLVSRFINGEEKYRVYGDILIFRHLQSPPVDPVPDI